MFLLRYLTCALPLTTGAHALDARQFVHDRLGVIEGQVLLGAGHHAAHAALAGPDDQQVGAHRGHAVQDLLLRAGAERQHGDDRAHADDDAQHGQKGAQLVGQQAAHI